MSKPLIHAKSSARKYGGVWQDYIKIHDWFDQTKAHYPGPKNRAILHNSFGIYLCEQVFGTSLINSDGKDVSVRDIGEQHCLEDLSAIPTLQDYLDNMEEQPWMSRVTKENCPTSLKEIMSKRKIHIVKD